MQLMRDLQRWIIKAVIKASDPLADSDMIKMSEPFDDVVRSAPAKIKRYITAGRKSVILMYNLKNCSFWTNVKDKDFGAVRDVISGHDFLIGHIDSDSNVADYYRRYRLQGVSQEKEHVVSYTSRWDIQIRIKLTRDQLFIVIPDSSITDEKICSTPLLLIDADLGKNNGVTLIINHTESSPEIVYLNNKKLSHRCNECNRPFISAVMTMYRLVHTGGHIQFYGWCTLKQGLKLMLPVFNSLTWMKREGTDVWTRLKCGYRHWPVPKHGKEGYRLISAPTGELKRIAAQVHENLSSLLYASDVFDHTVSYKPGVDYVKEIADRNLSISRVGKWCLEIDLKDFFTNITPQLVAELAAHNYYTFTQEFLLTLAPLLGFSKMFSKGYSSTRRTLYATAVGEILKLAMTVLPLWKRELGDYNFMTGEVDVKYGCSKAVQQYKKAVFHLRDFSSVIAGELKQRNPYAVISQCGVPQGAAFSGDIANVIARLVTDILVKKVKNIIADYKGDARKVDWLIYSDNIYIFYDLSDEIIKTLPEDPLKTFRREFRDDQWLRKVLVPWKIINIDREKRDVKILGIILDKDGTVRLSRRYRRKINQAMIHADRNQKVWTQKDEGQRNWYVHVQKYTRGNYSRELLNLQKEEKNAE